MAKATKTERVVREEIVTLVLSKTEAVALMAVTGLVNGSPKGTHREETDAVYQALARAGVRDSILHRNAFVGMLTAQEK